MTVTPRAYPTPVPVRPKRTPMRALTAWLGQGVRGMGTLPHVGNHPGAPFVSIMAAGLATSGLLKGGMTGLAMGLLFFGATLFPIFWVGSVSRARDSDRFVHADQICALLQAWAHSLPASGMRLEHAKIQMPKKGQDDPAWITLHWRLPDGPIPPDASIPDLPQWMRAPLAAWTRAQAGSRAINMLKRKDVTWTFDVKPAPDSAHQRLAAATHLQDIKARWAGHEAHAVGHA